VIALYILVSVIVTIVSTIFLPDLTNRDISQEAVYGAAAGPAASTPSGSSAAPIV